ncbi:MAG: Hsp20/alpha crystallin family protein [Gammaproteobacteria bacterium]|nr:molecular chaperone Hsp20 [Gammaproteobacteria bacterium]
MARGELIPWRRSGSLLPWRRDDGFFGSLRREIDMLHRDIDRLFDEMWSGRWPSLAVEPMGGDIMPQLDMTEDDQAFHLNVELPGMDEKDFEVTLRNHTLTIKGEKKEEKETKDRDVHRRERAYGYFRRSIELPADVDADKITATYRKGVLTIDLPKTKQAQDQAKRIEVKAA